ncbi:branched-chain amino acid ABC transporter permease/ATP-binding protein [Williamsia sp. 1135]|uniref:branched-chain amino acid ABC transporter permease/ATP-binding protein n=1 Tax=Williamsia sp. 1135 TaxID=1889262 RepID=UPI000A0F490A|nr:branched-chain amino acid ABC transporter permease/ATP-binding protein [Williamsia sp. 1135]ORM32153.1 ABC transporter [Williamsia sp. 1135]
MTEHFAYLFLGLGNGAVYAALGLALVMTFKSSGVVNFATGAVALYTTYTYGMLRQGELLNPIPGFPSSIDLGGDLGLVPAVAISLVIAAILGAVLYLAIFRPMRSAPVVAKAVASIGLMLTIQALLALRLGTSSVPVAPIFEPGTISIGESQVPTDRIWLAVVIVALATVVALAYHFSRFGVATEAAAESEKGAFVTGLSPDRIAISNWALSSVIAGLGGILIAPIVPLSPIAYTMFIVPALAAALVGNFSSMALAVAAGLGIGVLQSEGTHFQSLYDWVPDSGVSEAIPLILILVFLVVKGRPLPSRGAIVHQNLGRAPRPRRVLLPAIVGTGVAVAAVCLTSGSYRGAIIATFIFAILGLSQVVVTGFAGQVSLAQLTLAGAGAFGLSVVNTELGIPFPFAPILAALMATVIGVVVGLPALRIRGLPFMVVTLALAVFLEAFWFRNPSFNGGIEGANFDAPEIFGADLGIGAGENYPRISFGLMCLIIVVAAAVGVALLRRSRLGSAMLAVRANERAAAAAGINVSRTKLAAFAIGSFLAGISGTLLAYQQTLATAGSYSVFAGIAIFAVIYTAGITSVSGGLLAGVLAPGALLFVFLDRAFDFGDYYALVSGVLLIVTVMVNPDGIAGRVQHAIASRRQPAGTAPTGSEVARSADEADGVARVSTSDVPLLAISGVGVRYGTVAAVSDVSFEVFEGEIVGLIGPNGAGKTTLIDAISGFADADGTVTLGGQSLDGVSPHQRSRRGLGRTFQDVELYDDLSVHENVTVGARGGASGSAGVDAVLERLGLGGVADVTVASLSQGQRQLVSVARVLAGNPSLALLDEPAAGLDSTESRWLGARLRAVRDTGVTMLLVDHDMELVLSVCDRIIVLDLGKVIATGTPEVIRADEEVIRAYLGVPKAAGESSPPTELTKPGVTS